MSPLAVRIVPAGPTQENRALLSTAVLKRTVDPETSTKSPTSKCSGVNADAVALEDERETRGDETAPVADRCTVQQQSRERPAILGLGEKILAEAIGAER